ncbi:DUF2085 domain-containing protein [Planctomycetota bacterium]
MFHLLNNISSFVCHQDPMRTLTLASHVLPLCARCTGIYASFLFVWIGLQSLRSTRQWVLSRPREAAPGALALALGVMLSAAEARELFALPLMARLFVGTMTGSGLALVLKPLFNQLVGRMSKGQKAQLPALAVAVACASAVILLAWLNIRLSYYVLGYASALGVAALYCIANLNVASLILDWNHGALSRLRILSLVLLTITLILAEVILISVLKTTVLPWLRS